MNFEFTPEQQALRQHVREWVDRYCPQELMTRMDLEESFPQDLYDKMTDAGFHGVSLPEEYGGSGGNIIDQMIVAEELGRRLAGVTWMWAITSCFGGKSIGLFGTPEQKRRWLPGIIEGKYKVAIAITEPGGGTDILGAMRTFAEDQGDHYLVNGSKIWSTGAHIADWLLLIVRTRKLEDCQKKWDGITVMVVDAKSPGITARPIPKLGLKALGSCEVFLDNVKVPKENVLGTPGDGWKQLLGTLNNERILLGAICCGIGDGVLEEALKYASERQAFGRPIGAYQAIQHYIADMKIEIEAARMVMYKAAWLQSLGRECGIEATATKILTSEAAFKAADRGIQILGGYGYALEYPMQRYMRDARLFRIGPVTNEMARNYIAQNLGLPRSY